MEFPQMGSPLVRRCLSEAYGEGIRQIAVSTYLIVYRYDGDSVDVLALVYGPTVILFRIPLRLRKKLPPRN